MADSGSASKHKRGDGGGKKKNKRKSAEQSGDGAPSPSQTSASASPAQVSSKQSHATSGATNPKHKASPKQAGEGKKEMVPTSPSPFVQPNPTHTHEPTSPPQASADLSQSSLEGQVSKLKNTPKQGSRDKKDGETCGGKENKLGGKERNAGEALSGKERNDGKTPAGKEKKDGEALGNGRTPQKQEIQVKQGEGQQKVKAAEGKKPDLGDEGQKSKAALRAERRALQEAQRAAKEAKKNDVKGGGSGAAAAAAAVPGSSSAGAAPAVKKEVSVDKIKSAGGEASTGDKKSKKKPAVINTENETEEQMWARKEKEMLGKSLKIDNSILNLGFQYFHHSIVGANARCLALLATLKEVIAKYRTPEEKELARDLEKNYLNPCITYINYCRPLSTSMGNAIKHLKYHINRIPREMSDEEAIAHLQEVIDIFIQVNITKAAEAVALYANTKIDDGDVILIYAASSLIGQVLRTAHKKYGKRFRVIVVEGRPRTEGKSMLRYLVRCGIPCSYIYIGSASHAMREATKVFLGAAAMFAIGDMHSRTGNSIIAALAKANNIPVLVCCETYKFTDKVQLHSGDSNLHARGKDLVSIGHRPQILGDWEKIGLGLLNIMYDVTGSEYITALVTELGMLPCTSVPVVLRRQEDLS